MTKFRFPNVLVNRSHLQPLSYSVIGIHLIHMCVCLCSLGYVQLKLAVWFCITDWVWWLPFEGNELPWWISWYMVWCESRLSWCTECFMYGILAHLTTLMICHGRYYLRFALSPIFSLAPTHNQCDQGQQTQRKQGSECNEHRHMMFWWYIHATIIGLGTEQEFTMITIEPRKAITPWMSDTVLTRKFGVSQVLDSHGV